jgi:phosphoribosylaminoimidazole-succinocarboxamide synthase
MLSENVIAEALNRCISETDFASLGPKQRGKVRDIYRREKELVIISTDRLSAFDVVVANVPFKGQVLNELALYWFDKTKDIVPNHIKSVPHPNVVVVKECNMLPVEVIVRGYLTGSAWRDYQAGKDISGIQLEPGLKEFQRFSMPLLTPSTKAEVGDHDEPISCQQIVETGLVEANLWKKVEEVAMALFRRGNEMAAENNLILVDTKYEFGLIDGELVLADEVHTPDSSRYWYKDQYEKAWAEGGKPKQLDKEFIREWLMQQGFSGQGPAPEIPDQKRIELSQRYLELFEQVTGQELKPAPVLEESVLI